LIKYKRSILDVRFDQVFQQVDSTAGTPPKERLLNINESNRRVAFNENHDRQKVAALCEKLMKSRARNAKEVANGLIAELLKKKSGLRQTAKPVLLGLAELCSNRSSASEEARQISKELFFDYILQA
jgi:hypothetical protein